jgi:hypothetical protein
MEDHSKHKLRQSAISAVMTILMNSLMTFVLLNNGMPILVWGLGGAAFDLLPTTFMSVLMSTVMPAVMTEKLLRTGELSPIVDVRRSLPGNAFVRALIMAAIATLVLGSAFAAGLYLWGARTVSFDSLLVFKAVLGGLIGWFAAPIAVSQSLAVKTAGHAPGKSDEV